MKRYGILNSEVADVLAHMGHTDRICIGDCGLPIPEGTRRIDLALRFGLPSFMDVLSETGADMKIEKVILAEEIREKSPGLLGEIGEYLQGQGLAGDMVEFVPHEELKRLTIDCMAVIRTGETTPYANIILQSGCIF